MKLKAVNGFKEYYENSYVKQADIVLSEVGLGDVYFVDKDRFETFENKYVTQSYLVNILNKKFKIVVISVNNVQLANFDLSKESKE